MVRKILIIGGVAAGPKAAARIMRLNPQAQVTVLEKGKFISYAGCGLPYYVSDTIREQKDLMSTPVGVMRDAGFFQKVKNFTVLTETEAVEIDRAKKRVRVRRAPSGEENWLEYGRTDLEGRFRRWLKTSIRTEIIRRRMERVCSLLQQTDLSLNEIARGSGFATTAHFCRLFQRELGQTPSHYRHRETRRR